MTRRICEKTGLALTAGPADGFRIARESYGPLNPQFRDAESDALEWSRYDTVGRTIYACADRTTAFMELLAPYRTWIDRERRALQPVADALNVSLDDLWRDIVAEWDEAGTMKASWLPRTFREGRALYTIRFPAGWWIDINASETMAALNELPLSSGPSSHRMSDEPLTLSHITGDDRLLTTSIATALRDEVELDDGALPLGIQFISKHGRPSGGSGLCWAYWMRDVDNGLSEMTKILTRESIEESDPDFVAAQMLCKIKSR